jgi:glycosyltransferase involved in cell wall biosynthesis
VPHVGVHLDVVPHHGGAFQYVESVVRGLAPLGARGWRLTAFARHRAWRAALPPEFECVVRERTPIASMPSAILRRLDGSCRGARRAGRLDPLVRRIDAAGCDLVLFPSQEGAAYATAARTLVTIHDLMHRYERHFDEYRGREYDRRERHYRCVCATAAGILVDSDLGKRQVVESYGVSPDRIFVLPYAASEDLERGAACDVRAKYGLERPYVFYPAQFWEHKNHVPLLEAIHALRARSIDVGLVLCGAPKNGYRRVVRRIRELGLGAYVRILGYVPAADVPALYRGAAATAFVSSIGPTNIPPLEAMRLGSPLVVSNAYAMPDQVGDAALLVDPRNPADIAEKLASVLTDAPLRRTLVERGLARSARWTQARFGERLRQIVVELVTLRA